MARTNLSLIAGQSVLPALQILQTQMQLAEQARAQNKLLEAQRIQDLHNQFFALAANRKAREDKKDAERRERRGKAIMGGLIAAGAALGGFAVPLAPLLGAGIGAGIGGGIGYGFSGSGSSGYNPLSTSLLQGGQLLQQQQFSQQLLNALQQPGQGIIGPTLRTDIGASDLWEELVSQRLQY